MIQCRKGGHPVWPPNAVAIIEVATFYLEWQSEWTSTVHGGQSGAEWPFFMSTLHGGQSGQNAVTVHSESGHFIYFDGLNNTCTLFVIYRMN